MGISSTWQRLAGPKRANGDPWTQSDQRLLSHAPTSETDDTSKSQLLTSNFSFSPSKPHEEQSISMAFFKDDSINIPDTKE